MTEIPRQNRFDKENAQLKIIKTTLRSIEFWEISNFGLSKEDTSVKHGTVAILPGCHSHTLKDPIDKRPILRLKTILSYTKRGNP